jgi:NAD(P)H-dependent FMN reductase
MRITALVGSLRRDSFNMQLAVTMQERYKERMSLSIADLRVLPHYNQDDEQNPPPEVREFKKSIAEADGVLIITPEYNWSIPGVLKNALDWLSRAEQEMIGKPVMTAGVTPGQWGTIRAQLHLREILASPGLQAKVLPPAGNELLIHQAPGKFADGRLADEAALQRLDEVTDKFLKWIEANRR